VRSIIDDNAVLRAFAVIEPRLPAALAVSGGPDSIALMHLALRWCSLSRRDVRSFVVLTVDHGLRPESPAEAEFTGESARALGLPHAILTWAGNKPKAGLQAAARAARYALMTSYCRAHGLASLVTAHTENDQAETMLMRLKRGSGIDGLAAMAPVSDRDGIALIRPLLQFSKARLIAYLRERAIPYVTDPSNENALFERTRLRHAMAACAKAGITRRALARSAARLHRSREALARFTDEFLDEHLTVFPLGQAEVDRKALDGAPAEIALRVYSRVFALAGGQIAGPRLSKLERLLDQHDLPRWETTLGGCLLAATPSKLQFIREVGRMTGCQLVLKPGESVLWDRRFRVSLGKNAMAGVLIKPLGTAGWLAYSKAVRESPGHVKPPRLAALAVPAVFKGRTPVSAPLLGWRDVAAEVTPEQGVEVALEPRLARFLKPI
jgi:tRNA(Ile)-lysidine synthase